ncbi:pollen-specific leucine-rich repeat extensin-like protein 2 [Musa acuminata AAA Group]|uniref:pollen-specific leucine-rich repeat extensin-like protein 2 n=1 Tax=Musa acuminata AAA Group TaxID=214697 RepID=UPI0031D64103
MNASKFMDKQIMELSGSSAPADKFFDLLNPQEDHQIDGAASGGGSSVKKEQQQGEKAEIFPSYEFHPIRAVGSSSPPTTGGGLGGSWPTWGSVDSKLASFNLQNAGILEPHEPTKASHQKEKSTYDVAMVAEIDTTVKRYADNLMNALEGVNSRLLQLENRTHHLENSVDELKVAIGNNNGSTDGRLRQFDNILREVQSGVQILRDKQDIVEAQLHLAQLKASKGEQQQQQNSKTVQPDSRQHEVPASQQPIQQSYQQPVPPAQPTVLPAPQVPNAPPPAPQQIPPLHMHPQLPQPQVPSVPSLPRESGFPPAAQHAEATHQQYQVPVQHPQAAPPPPPSGPQHYQPPHLPQYSQPPQSQHSVNPTQQLPPPIPQHAEESAPYVPPPQSYPPSIYQPATFPQPPSGPPQQFFVPNSSMYGPPTSKPNSGPPPSSGYGPPTGPSYSDSAYGGLPSGQSSSPMKHFTPSVPSGGSSNYPRLPTARILPQAPQTASGSSSPSGTRLPIDDVVEKVATMGFSRDQVRATVRKLTENGQSVDLNVVLDRLMNDG